MRITDSFDFAPTIGVLNRLSMLNPEGWASNGKNEIQTFRSIGPTNATLIAAAMISGIAQSHTDFRCSFFPETRGCCHQILERRDDGRNVPSSP
jgi:hypothetical protein